MQPVVKLFVARGVALVLVFPVCGDTFLCHLVHLLASYLYLYPFAVCAHECGVECLVAVGPWLVHPVAQTVGMGVVQLCECYVYVEALVVLVTSFARIEYDTYCKYVVYILKCHMLLLHLVPDGVGRFYATYNPVFQPHGI